MATPAQKLHLEVATPLGLALQVDAESVQTQSVQGELGVLPGHVPILIALKAGVLRYREGGKEHIAAIGAGFAEAGPEKVLLLADEFLAAKDVSLEQAQADLAEANARLGKAGKDATTALIAEVEHDVAWAQARIQARTEASK